MSLIKTLLKIKFGVLIFIGGYVTHSFLTKDNRYSIKRIKETPYLVDRITKNSFLIPLEDFRTNSLEYKVLIKKPDNYEEIKGEYSTQ